MSQPLESITTTMSDSLVFDIGGTNLRAGRYSVDHHRLLQIKKKLTPNIWNTSINGEPVLARLVSEMKILAEELFPNEDPLNVAIGVPGPISPTGEILQIPTILGNQFSSSNTLLGSFQDIWPCSRVQILNDVSAAGYFLHHLYKKDLCVITVSSGIGSKLFINGKPYTGFFGRGGEIGHWVTDSSESALTCECGGKGHLGGIASGRGALSMARSQAELNTREFQGSLLAKNTDGDYLRITTELLVEAYLKEDKWTIEIIDRASKELAKVIALIHVTTGIEHFSIIGGFALALGDSYRKKLSKFASGFSWDLGQDWDSMILLGPDHTEMGLLGAGIFSEAN